MNQLSRANRVFKRGDLITLACLLAVVMVIYYPVLYATYLYTDEATQLWFSQEGTHLTWIPQGRWISYKLFSFLFSAAHTVHSVLHIRLFSLLGWMVCLPAWYYILKDCLVKNALPVVLLPLAMVYLVCMPPFSIYIGWATCSEMFIACTAGLLSGYAMYKGVQYKDGQVRVAVAAAIPAFIAGMISLFTYQNGFGCFFIPFFIQLIAGKQLSKRIIAGIAAALLLYGLYYLLFTLSLQVTGTAASERSSLASNPIKKIAFLFTRPMASACHFTWLFNEKSVAGEIMYGIVFIGWVVISFIRLRTVTLTQRLLYVGMVIAFFILVYLPSLLVDENFSSNRTLFALNLVVFLLLAETVLAFIKTSRGRYSTAGIIAGCFFINAGYNFRVQFTRPLTAEFNFVKTVIAQQYTAATDTIYFIRPTEDAFEKKYGIIASWDEFGVPSTAKKWTAEPLIKQLIFEQTGNRAMAEKIVVKSREGNDVFIQSAAAVTKRTMLINIDSMLHSPQ